MRRPRFNTLLGRLLVAYLLPTLGLLALFGILALRVSERALDRSLGERLTGIAQAAAAQVRPEAIAFLEPGDDNSRTAIRLRHKLDELAKRTRVARIVILDRQLRSRSDTDSTVRIGDRYYQAEADRAELARVFSGKTASSVLFRGTDQRYYKIGYAPVVSGKQVIAAIGVRASAAFFDDLRRLQTYLLLLGIVIATLVVTISVLVARRITRPVRRLAAEAKRIGAGDLEHSIAIESRDEVGLLATTMNEMRKDLHARDQQLQMMLSGIAHEVRNPLGGIALFAGLLRDELDGDAERVEMVERIEREMGYLKKVVGEFLDYARKNPPNLDVAALPPLVDDVGEVLAAEATAAGIELKLDAQPAQALADVEQLRRVVLNLARNALQATERGGEVRLTCGVVDDAPFIAVVDTGAGIPQEVMERIFTPFFTTREKGTGLGLALSKKIVDEHGGGIEVQSSSEGTTIRVTLKAPRASDQTR